METFSRPAVRVICFDAAGRVLMLHWRDPHDGHHLWEPPGGGIDPGETPLRAARRELAEETGLDPSAIDTGFRLVPRDAWWKGRRYVGGEQFFAAYFRTDRPELTRENLLEYERSALIGHDWVAPAGLPSLPGLLEPPDLPAVIGSLRATTILVGQAAGLAPWQVAWEATEPCTTRVRPVPAPVLTVDDWVDAIDAAVALAAPGVVLAAHGTGALAVAHWAARGGGGIAGALLTDVPDSPDPASRAGLPRPPAGALPFPSIVASGSGSSGSSGSVGLFGLFGSSGSVGLFGSFGSPASPPPGSPEGDPPASRVASSRAAAEAWGSRFVDTGPPGTGAWPEARSLLGELRA